MGFEIVTGYTGEAHVYSSDVRALNRNLVGNGNYVLKHGGQFEYELVDANTFRLYEGDLLIQGVHGRIRTGEYVEVHPTNATQGKYRNILVCVYYAMDTTSVEHMGVDCIYGEETSATPQDPTLSSDDLSRNGRHAYFPLYRIRQYGSNVESVEKIFKSQEYTMDDVSNLVSKVFLTAHPVGSIFISTSPTDPGYLYGGTWVRWGNGRVPVGVDTSVADFNEVEKTGGASSVALGINQLPAHSHGLNNHTHGKGSLAVTVASHSHSGLYHGNSEITYYGDLIKEGGLAGLRGTNSGTRVKTGNTQPSASVSGNTAAASGSTANAGSGQGHNNLQPYITCYMWKRTA